MRENPFPQVEPILGHQRRPLFSVMIPTYNCADYLRETLDSLLVQDMGEEKMEIVVVDDCSTNDNPEAVVQEMGKGRVRFFRQWQNVGAVENFNTCLRESRGHYIHLLHGDDTIQPGFYEAYEKAFRANPEIGAVFSRYVRINGKSQAYSISPFLSNEDGVLDNLLELLAIQQRVQFVSMVVKREAYEKVGGFRYELIHCADWDMWARIASQYPVYHIVEPLGNFRIHQSSDTSKLTLTGDNVEDEFRAAKHIASYLDAEIADRYLQESVRSIAYRALEASRRMRKSGNKAWKVQLAKSIKLNPNPRYFGLPLLRLLLKR